MEEKGARMKTRDKRKFVMFILFVLTMSLTSCVSNVNFETYDGDPLQIAVVGNIPIVKEQQVKFKKVSMDEIPSMDLGSYDAVFIREDQLLEASENQYTDVYLASSIPFFFFGTNNFLPFTQENYAYNQSSYWTRGTSYTVGILALEGSGQFNTWGYGFYNDLKTEDHIRDIYSRIFKTIDLIKRY